MNVHGPLGQIGGQADRVRAAILLGAVNRIGRPIGPVDVMVVHRDGKRMHGGSQNGAVIAVQIARLDLVKVSVGPIQLVLVKVDC